MDTMTARSITRETLPQFVRLPELMREWMKKAASFEVPLTRSAPYLELQIRAKKLEMVPMVRFEVDDMATAKFAKAALDLGVDSPAKVRDARSQLLKAAFESTRCSLVLRDSNLVPPMAKGTARSPNQAFEAHEADGMRDRNFASFGEAFEWLDRAESTHALAKRERCVPCTNRSFLVVAHAS